VKDLSLYAPLPQAGVVVTLPLVHRRAQALLNDLYEKSTGAHGTENRNVLSLLETCGNRSLFSLLQLLSGAGFCTYENMKNSK
jgi:hypothetical protein